MEQHGSHTHGAHDNGPSAGAVAEGVKDPACGMVVDPHTAKHRHTVEGRPYYFCSATCRERFTADPTKYLAPGEPAAAEPAGTIYTCPMHPEIRQNGPGSSPICGMALEPEVATAGAEPNPELADMTRRFWVGLALALPVLALEMGGHMTGLHQWLGQQRANWMQFILATPVVLWAGWPFFERGWASLKTRNLNMFTLIAMGVGVAWVYSVFAVIRPGLFPTSLRGPDGAVAVYFEAAAVITVLVLLGQVLELRARAQTSGAIKALLDLSPKMARRIKVDGTDEDVSLEQVAVGEKLRVRPGERVPLDGEILEGRSAIDESMVTGESMPVTKGIGEKVIGGTMKAVSTFMTPPSAARRLARRPGPTRSLRAAGRAAQASAASRRTRPAASGTRCLPAALSAGRCRCRPTTIASRGRRAWRGTRRLRPRMDRRPAPPARTRRACLLAYGYPWH